MKKLMLQPASIAAHPPGHFLYSMHSFLVCVPAFGLVFVLTFMASIAWAQNSNSNTEEGKTRKRSAQILSLSVYKKMTAVQEALQSEDYSLALDKLNELLARGDKLKPYDKAKTYEMMVNVHLSKEDYTAAVKAAKNALDMNILGTESTTLLHHRLFYIHYFREDYDKAIKHMTIWFQREPNPDTQAYFTAAQVYALTEQMNKALQLANQGMESLKRETLDENGNVIQQEHKDAWYRLLISIHLKLKNYREASEVIEQAISRWPGIAEFYHQLSAVYQELKREKEAMAILSIAYQNNMVVKESDIIRLVQHYRYHDYPHRGAAILDAGIETRSVKINEDNWESLSNAWLQAREWGSADVALKNAAQLSKQGKHWLRLCQTAFQDERWGISQRRCKKALEKGGLESEAGTAWYLYALAYYYKDDLLNAKKGFEKCIEWKKTKADCSRWNVFVEQTLVAQEEDKKEREMEVLSEEERKRKLQEEIDRALFLKS